MTATFPPLLSLLLPPASAWQKPGSEVQMAALLLRAVERLVSRHLLVSPVPAF